MHYIPIPYQTTLYDVDGYMFKNGFLGTSAPFYMDSVTLIVALLPLLLLVSIQFAKNGKTKLHLFSQLFIFVLSVLIIFYFEYGVRVGGGFDVFLKGSKVSHNYALTVLIVHIIIATIMLFVWSKTVISGLINYSKGNLPGKKSNEHKKNGIRAFIWISLTSLTGIWVYMLLFMFR